MSKSLPMSAGLAVGGLLALWHACWALLVALGVAQGFLDWIFRLHMIAPPYQVMPFDLMSATLLVVVTGVIGFVAGWVGGMIWSACIKK